LARGASAASLMTALSSYMIIATGGRGRADHAQRLEAAGGRRGEHAAALGRAGASP
jgi:hypothetical protein